MNAICGAVRSWTTVDRGLWPGSGADLDYYYYPRPHWYGLPTLKLWCRGCASAVRQVRAFPASLSHKLAQQRRIAWHCGGAAEGLTIQHGSRCGWHGVTDHGVFVAALAWDPRRRSTSFDSGRVHNVASGTDALCPQSLLPTVMKNPLRPTPAPPGFGEGKITPAKKSS